MKFKSRAARYISIGFLLILCFGRTFICTAAEDKPSVSADKEDKNADSLSSYLGVWYDKASVDSGQTEYTNPNVKLVITGISKDKLLFSISQQYCILDSAIALKQEDGSYQFSFNEVKEDDLTECGYGTEYKGKFIFNGMKLTAEIGGSTEEGIGYTGELIYYSGLDTGTPCNLVDLMTDYKTAYNGAPGDITLVEDKDSGLVAGASFEMGSGFWTSVRSFEVDGITICSFQEDCIAKFGQPVSTRTMGEFTEVVYLVDEKYYLTSPLNRYGVMKTMKLSYANEEKVLGYEIDGDFKIHGTKIIEYLGGYDTARTIVIPEKITEIGEMAFYIQDDITFPNQAVNMKKVSLCIPKDVRIDEDAFNTIGPMNITFEEGRSIIEKRAFRGCSAYTDFCNESIEITLPSTIKSIGESSFETFICGRIILNLNEGLEEIGDYALSGTKCKLPSTVKKLGDYALNNWWYDSKAEGELSGGYVILPKSLEEMGDHCIYLEMPTKKITIPASVKKMGERPITYGDNAYMGGVVVEKKSRYFKSDKNGWLYTKNGKNLLYAASFHGNLVVPEGVEYVAEGSLNLDLNGEGGPQKIILPKSLKKYNQRAATNCTAVFKGNPPQLVGVKGAAHFTMTFYVPKNKLKSYKNVFQLWKSDCKILEAE
ncbi:leucine-rich repeat protein [Anaerocolumna sedimenticola]|uniref:Leucine-rich repeat protein n=1 Tax=Anaerocolumna sedimenticola TaxID=2696063 RepID=A0A6P1TN14_9FIRM|nr:leucine-rich repeat domain-containing protein [Anaerocolumna sedimenticola]QHQ61562.1 leucine-rich repeat protein [Anaerocolumna sedimenticola]